MQTKSINKKILIWLFVVLPLIGVFLFRKSFDLGLYGDDWQHLYILWREFFVYKTKSFFDIRSYLNPYFPESLYLGIISHFWGYYPPAYFISSFITRVFANIALYFFSYELTKTKFAAFLTTLIFLFSAAGLQTTDWVFNMNTYAGLGLLAIASTIYLKIRKLKTFKSWHYPLFLVTFTLALATVPTRMHGAVPFIILTDLFLTFFVGRQKIKFDKYLIARLLLAVFIFVTLIHFKSFGEGSFTTDRLSSASQTFQLYDKQGFFAIWFYFLGILGHLILPDTVYINNLSGVILSTSIISIILGIFVLLSIFKPKNLKLYLPIIIFNSAWALVLTWLAIIDPNPIIPLNPYLPSAVLFSIALGGQFIFWSIWISMLTRKISPYLSNTLIISLIWIITLSITYWLFTPNYIIETTGRYMTMGTAGFSIWLAAITTLILSNTFFKKAALATNRLIGILTSQIFILILLFGVIINIYTSQSYFSSLAVMRNRHLTDRVWNTLTTSVPKLDPEAPSVFYFTTNNPLALYEALTFGFFMRAGLSYQIPDESKTPLPSTNYQELLAYVHDGTPLQKVHGRKAGPVPLSRIYAFDYRNGELTNITEIVRHQLIEDLKIQ